jgi:branched-subunit amino acid aminotransferase/4-amino-4-deoxychorismate lyase
MGSSYSVFNPHSDLHPPASEGGSRIAYHSGRWVDGDRVALSAADPAVTQAVTAVERLRAYQGVLFQRDRHLDRWARTTNELLIAGLPMRNELSSLLDQLVRRNAAWIAAHHPFGVVMFASPGCGDEPTLVMDLYPIDPAQMEQRITRGSTVLVTSVEQPPNASWSRNIKVRCRLHYYLADLEARRTARDAIGVLVDADGTITESSIANVLIVEKGRVVCPPPDQILLGVSLQVIRDLAMGIGIQWCEERITPQRLRRADEVLLTGTSCGIWFGSSVDGSEIRSCGPVYRQLRAAFETLIE